ncbi:MAG: tol-pal system-associated acyl-CoA thioesterase [Pseudomonadota bacterium]
MQDLTEGPKPVSEGAGAIDGGFDGPVHCQPVRVYYEDTDMSGIVYHANYLRFFERGRSNYLRGIGVHHTALAEGDDPIYFVVARMDIAFRKPARIDDLLTVKTLFDEVGGASLGGEQTILRGEAVLVSARVRAACIDKAGRPRRLPLAVREALSEKVDASKGVE